MDTICTEVSAEEIRRMPPIPSGYETDRTYRLEEKRERTGYTWKLREERLRQPIRKVYDSGDFDEWVEPYLEVSPLEKLRFVAASRDGKIVGLLTWQQVEWNETLWLLDIRTSPASRRAGVGTSLLEWLKAEAWKRHVRGISLETQTNNHPAVQFYRKHGFLLTGFNHHLYTNGDLRRQDVALFLFWEAGL